MLPQLAVSAIAALALNACSKSPPAQTAAAPKPAAPAVQPAAPTPTPAVHLAIPTGSPTASAGPAIETVDQRVSYGVGYNVGSTVAKQTGLTVSKDALLAGLEDGLAGAKTRLPDAEIEAAFVAMQKRVAEKRTEAVKTFFEQNARRPGVTVTPSGLQFEVLARGTGTVKPRRTDTVTVNYVGRLLDGTVFDSSQNHGGATQFPVGAVIAGWTEALQLMSVGDKWRLFVPAALAYGPRGNGRIPPNAPLIFEVELLSIK